ncbi:MAG TPA: Tex family protein [Synergistaceae bacterium]|nr:Tex family protein [Synergistaceae bacterium]HQH78300.1 Tex family protein [Synergistaceae bacterium]HQK24751.1 Tex family protein [Synergistaceae bacterium]
MRTEHAALVASSLHLRQEQVEAVAALFDEGCTLPFIARYRKERTGSLDEVDLAAIRDRMAALAELDRRRNAVRASLEERGLLLPELGRALDAAKSLTEVEDLYLPFRPKRRTRASVARERGLEPLADLLWAQKGILPLEAARPFVDAERGVPTEDDALDGAGDIMAERVSESLEARRALRRLFVEKGTLSSRMMPGKEEAGGTYRDYFDWNEPLARIPSHRVLAIFRGEAEGALRVHIAPPEPEALEILEKIFVHGRGADAEEVRDAVHDAWKRLLQPSLETEARQAMKKRADDEAIHIFAENVRDVLMAPPLGEKRILAVDPGWRTGCKAVCLDAQGNLLHRETFFLLSAHQREEARSQVDRLVAAHDLEAVGVGNGTGGRETEAFLREVFADRGIPVVTVNESGASVYSASEVAREEFPDLDLTYRGAVSIGRRLQDPLAELVKIDPKSIGVGQYQHDVDQKALRQALDDTVERCVASVGVDLNTASQQLLERVPGVGPKLATQILAFRRKKGPFRSRSSLRRVPRLGPKAFEQAAGFLRIRGGEQPLDASAVHPEHYDLVGRMASDLGCTVEDLLRHEALRQRIDPSAYVQGTVGLPTLKDILEELAKPGRDPRSSFALPAFSDQVHRVEDLAPGMVLPGVVTNVTAFGAFVDVGVHQDGLVHVSRLGKRGGSPFDVVRVGQWVSVAVLEVDLPRRRIALSMRPEDLEGPPE